MAPFYVIAFLVVIGQSQARSSLAFPFGVRIISESFGCTDQIDGNTCGDCNTIHFCSKGQIQYKLDCKYQNPLTPYCNPKTKRCEANSDVCTPAASFTCKTPGLFPDAMDCTRFVACDRRLQASTYTCGKNIYDHVNQKCAVGIPCHVFTPEGLCKGKIDKLAIYPPDNSLFAFCPASGFVTLWSCPSKNYKMNLNSSSCEFFCKTDGYFADEEDETKYYDCVKNGAIISATRKNCIQGAIFDPISSMCQTQSAEVGPGGEQPTTQSSKP